MPSVVSLNDVDEQLASEGEAPSLADFAEEPGGAWPKGWYSAEIIEGYSTRKGTVFTTEDTVSKNGESRNTRICFRVSKSGDEPRTIQEQFNYRPTDFTPQRLAFIKEARQEFKGVKGKWANSDIQRSSLAVAKFGQLEKALGFRLKLTAQGNIQPSVFVSQKLDVYLTVGENGYNEVTQFAPAGTRTGSAPKKAKSETA